MAIHESLQRSDAKKRPDLLLPSQPLTRKRVGRVGCQLAERSKEIGAFSKTQNGVSAAEEPLVTMKEVEAVVNALTVLSQNLQEI
ncbi:hypothetical protein ABH899_003188 [Paenibacillus sp. RC84]